MMLYWNSPRKSHVTHATTPPLGEHIQTYGTSVIMTFLNGSVTAVP